jgi:hypothetical protein
MFKFIKHIFTGIDNETWDIGRILWAKMCLVYCSISAWHTYHSGSFDPQQWAIGASAILAGGGGSLALKSKTEPSDAGTAHTNN